MTLANPSLARDFEAALAWWRDAGVDCDFSDDATAWLSDRPLSAVAAGADAAPTAARRAALQPQDRARDQTGPAPKGAVAFAAPSPATPPIKRRNLLGDSPPQDLASFHDWWLTAPQIDTTGLYPRIAPRGASGAALMVLVPQPEEHDRAGLLEGPQGRLLANMLAAMGLEAEAVYLASVLPSHTPLADLAALAAGGLDTVLAHHLALVAPRRLLVLGTGLAPMLSAQSDQPLREINHNGGKLPVMVSETLDALMEMPRLKARFWRRWMEWSATQ